jgi:hypothetical protein
MAESYLGGHTVMRLQRPKGEKRKDAVRKYWAPVKQGGKRKMFVPPAIPGAFPDLSNATTQNKIRRRGRKRRRFVVNTYGKRAER